MATIPGVCRYLPHTLRCSLEYRCTVKIVCDVCFCTVESVYGFGSVYYTCDRGCGFKACTRCASLIQGQTNNNVGQVQESSSGGCRVEACTRCASLIQGQTSNNVGQVQESSSGPTAVHPWLSYFQLQPSSNPPNPFTSSATTIHSPASQPKEQPRNIRQLRSQRNHPPNPFASSTATNQSEAQQQWTNLPNPIASSAETKNSEARQQRSNPFNPFASLAATKNSQFQQQRTTTQGRQDAQQRDDVESSGLQINQGSLQQKETVNATQSSPSSPWGNLHKVNVSDDHEQQKRAVNVAQSSHASPLARGLDAVYVSLEEVDDAFVSDEKVDDVYVSDEEVDDVYVSDEEVDDVYVSLEEVDDLFAVSDEEVDDVYVSDEEEDDDEKQPVIPCAGSLGHELQFLQRSPYIQSGIRYAYGCNMCCKTGSKDLYHCEICQFDSHKACAEIQEEVKVFFHKHPLQRDHMDDEEFTCRFCVGDTEAGIRPWVFKCLTCPNFTVHARCAKYAKSLKHKSHPHTLKLVQNPVTSDSLEVCDGCCNPIHQGYHYTCTAQMCDFDLHPLCAILPPAPFCRLNSTHRVKLDYHLLASCHLCKSQDDEACWMYRCTVCDVCMHIDCFNLELSDSDEELSDGDEEDEDFGELCQKFLKSIEDFGSQGIEEEVEKLSELVDSFKSNTKARSSLARQHSVKSSLYPTISSPAQSEVHILNDGFAKMSLGDSSRSEFRNRDADKEERRRAEQAAKDPKAERRREKAARRALQEKENVAWREKIASQMQNIANELQNIQYHQQAGSSDVAIAKRVADLQAYMEKWKSSDAKQYHEQSKLLQERHQEQTKHLQDRHYKYMSCLHEIIRTQVHSQTRAVPRLVLCSETTRISRKLLTVLRVGLKGVRLDLLCEHAEQPHVVSGAPGCEINQKVAGERWTNLQPFLAAGLQIVTLAVNSASGMGAVLPNLHQMVWDIHAVDLGEHAMPTGRNKRIPKPEPVDEEAAADWLVFYLRDQNINIAETFKLHRVRYKSPVHVKGTVGWLCRHHLAKGMKDLVLDRFP